MSLTPGSQLVQRFTKPVSVWYMKSQVKPETTVMIEYGMSTIVRSVRRGMTIRCITSAMMKPRTSSTTTVMTVMRTVAPIALQKTESPKETT